MVSSSRKLVSASLSLSVSCSADSPPRMRSVRRSPSSSKNSKIVRSRFKPRGTPSASSRLSGPRSAMPLPPLHPPPKPPAT
eukprot:5310751-Pyramimonas_sp.AAC.1